VTVFLIIIIILIVHIKNAILERDIKWSHGSEGFVLLDKRNGYASKWYHCGSTARIIRGFTKNVEVLKRMEKSDRVPKLVSYDPRTKRVTMTYCGSPLSLSNAPKDLREQLNQIKNDLKEAGIEWIDPALGNFVVDKTGFVRIIDFGFRTYDKNDAIARDFKNGPLDIEHVLKELRLRNRYRHSSRRNSRVKIKYLTKKQ
jgi:hypothetical protein